MSDVDIEFYWDPICPFAWITSRWVVKVAEQTGASVDWRFIPLRLLNADRDYATEFPPDYPRLHGAGLRMLRVAAAVRAEVGRELMGPLYTAYGESIWDVDPPADGGMLPGVGEAEHLASVLATAGLDTGYAAAADDEGWDTELAAETEHALARTGRDVGTPIISVDPPDGPAFFGPVISRVPTDDEAIPLWESILTLAAFPGFSELKRSLREPPQLRLLGADVRRPVEQDWQGGRLRPT